jgi:hypothetical protein
MRAALTTVVVALAVPVGAGVAAAQDGPPTTPPLAPAITDITATWKGKGRIKLHAQVVPRGAEVEKVVFRYRGERFKARHMREWDYARTVDARGGDSAGDTIRFKVRACTATTCVAKTATRALSR